MNPADLLRALPGVVLWAVIPGLSAAVILGRRAEWRERLAMAPGLGAGLVGITGLLYHDLHIGFRPLTVAPVVVVVTVAALITMRRERKTPGRPAPDHGPLDLRLVASALAAGAVSVAMLAVPLAARDLPLNGDAPVHGVVAVQIERQQDALPVIPDPAVGTSWDRPRNAVEAQSALIAGTGGPAPDRNLVPVFLLAALLLPLSLACLALEATGSRRVALLTPWLSLGMATPMAQLGLGEFPLLVDSTLVVPLALAARRCLRSAWLGPDHLLVAALTAAIWAVHGLEVLTVIACLGILIVVAMRGLDPRRGALRFAALLAACATGAVAVTVITRLPAVPPASVPAVAGAAVSQRVDFIGRAPDATLSELLRAFSDFTFPTIAVTVLWVGALALTVRAGSLRWAAASSVALLVAFVDTASHAALRPIWGPLFPWSVPDRLAAIQVFLVPLLIAFGLDRVASAVSALRRPWLPAAAAAALAVAGSLHTHAAMTAQVDASGRLTTADLSAMQDLSAALPAGSVVLTQGQGDSMQWLDSETRLVPLLSKADVDSYPSDGRLTAPAQACNAPELLAAQLGEVDAVVVGSRPRAQITSQPWDPSCLARVPGLTPLGRWTGESGGPAVFLTTGGRAKLVATAAPSGSR